MEYFEHDLEKVMSFNAHKIIEKIKKLDLNVLLYGAGIQCRTFISLLKDKGIKEDQIKLLDSNKTKSGRKFENLIILDSQQLSKFDCHNSIVFITCCFPSQILAAVPSRYETYSIIPIYDQLKSLLPNIEINNGELKYERNIGDITREFILYDTEFRNLHSTVENKNLRLKSIDAVVTEGCSLKCKNCSNLMQYYEKPLMACFELLASSTDTILDNVDYVYEWRILGGEPFIFRYLDKYLLHLKKHKNFGNIIIYTNGTILPKQSLISAIKESGSIVDISNYGEHSRKLKELTSCLKENNIPFACKEPEWTDSGRVTPTQNLESKYLEERFFNCCTKDVLTLLHGYLYRCPFSANLMNLSDNFLNESDRVFVNNYPNDIRERIRSLYRDKAYLSACDNCNGRDYTVPLIPVAEQTRKVLSLPN